MGTQEGTTDEKHTCRFPQGGFCSSQQLAYPYMAGTGTPRCLTPGHRNPSPRSDGDLPPRRSCKEQGKTTPPLTLPLSKGLGTPTVSRPSSMNSWLGPTRRGTVDKQLSPRGSGLGRGGSPGAGGAPVKSQPRGGAGDWRAGLLSRVFSHVSQGITGMHTWKDDGRGLWLRRGPESAAWPPGRRSWSQSLETPTRGYHLRMKQFLPSCKQSESRALWDGQAAATWQDIGPPPGPKTTDR